MLALFTMSAENDPILVTVVQKLFNRKYFIDNKVQGIIFS